MTTASTGRRILAILVAIAMIVTVFSATPAMAKKKKSNKGPRLVKSVTVYNWDSSKKKWDRSVTKKYKYNKKKDPASISYIYEESMSVTKNKFKYNKKKKRTVAKVYNVAGTYVGKRTYKNGKCTNENTWNKDKTSKYVTVNTFGKKQYLKKVVDTDKYLWNKKWETYKYEKTYSTTLKKGLPKKIVASSKSNGYVSSYKYLTTFNAKGLVANISSQYEATKTPEYKVKYTYKNGRAVKAIVSEYDSYSKKWKTSKKYVIKYTKKKVSKDRYAKIPGMPGDF